MKIKRYISYILLACSIFLSLCYYIIDFNGNSHIYSSLSDIPHRECGLVLGTSKYTIQGTINPYYKERINGIVSLYRAGKIDFIVVSGDNSSIYYNEPQRMKNDLIKAQVPKEIIVPDYAGFRTFDSIIRLKKIFNQNSCIIVSQRFHLERAITIAQKNELYAIGYEVPSPDTHNLSKVQGREILARVKLFLDFIFNKQPHFLGDKEKVPTKKELLSHDE